MYQTVKSICVFVFVERGFQPLDYLSVVVLKDLKLAEVLQVLFGRVACHYFLQDFALQVLIHRVHLHLKRTHNWGVALPELFHECIVAADDFFVRGEPDPIRPARLLRVELLGRVLVGRDELHFLLLVLPKLQQGLLNLRVELVRLDDFLDAPPLLDVEPPAPLRTELAHLLF